MSESRKVNLIWVKDLKNEEERTKFKETVLNSQKVLDKLREIVYNMSIDRERVKSTDYDSPSWAYKQAHLNGEQEAYRKVIEILTFNKEH